MDYQTILRQFQRRAREPQTAPDTQSNQRAQEAQGSQGHQGTPQLVRETPAMQGARDAQRPQGAQGAQRPQATKRAQGDAMNATAKSQDGRQMQDSQMPDDQHYEHPLDQDPEEQLKRFREKHAYKETFHKELGW
ncbi:Protein of unknown function [Pyronema omphalodes CBS 100304]|uniref:Uncharacterized protein n=1 Tax=Pyronema omphalodes (strain CBS 100304) TaxID=1076935 RepID=U4KX25_PYROM|nr:Protein of unknown function [Pyronema omphalodes CBS 100304]